MLAASAPTLTTLKPFLEKHCFDCHDDTTQKGGLNLETVAFSLTDRENFLLWENVHDRVQRGEMPPAKRERPDAPATAAALKFLSAELISANLAARTAGARVLTKRLNAAEFRLSLEALLGAVARLDLLEEEIPVASFDTLDHQLGSSGERIENFLSAIAAATTSAAARLLEENPPASWHLPPDALLRRGDLERFAVAMEGQDLVVYLIGWEGIPTLMTHTWAAPAHGWYRVRVNAAAYRSEEPRSFLLRVGKVKEFRLMRPVGYASAPVGEPEDVEFWCELEPGDGLKLERVDSDPMFWRHTKIDLAAPLPPALKYRGLKIDGPFLHRAHHPEPVLIRLAREYPRWQDDPVQRQAFYLAFAAAAYRRPAAEIAERLRQMLGSLSNPPALGDALRRILSSPEFMLRFERVGPLDDHELATRLAFFLTSCTPDATLLALASAERLRDPAVLREQTNRLLDSPASDVLIQRLGQQWLDLRNIAATDPDERLYGKWDIHLQNSIVRETEAFLAAMLRDNLPATSLISSDFTFANARLAQHYGLPAVAGETMQKIALPKSGPRGGLWTHASIMKVSANGTVSSPVIRGLWLMRHLLDEPPPPPPPGVPAVEPDIRGAKSLRDQLALHSNSASCAGCHQRFEPYGWALEAFDPTGRLRSHYQVLAGSGSKVTAGAQVDTSAVAPDGTPFSDIQDLRRLLLSDPDRLARAILRKLAVYATGHDIEFADRATLERCLDQTRASGHGVRDLVHALIASDLFRQR